ncbi:putative adhesin [Vibrio cholerae]|uniref:putative adhesin n=1 Tax=Vibrio cholerae TaxID=666 RepID=UPI0004E3A1AE|nr:hypothetical protein [Vibrio cholerae]EGR2417037.1 hypothetical protein [Vibrio cholerae]EGR2474696.1 hypothetical protein [Vibrio cholerae]EGR4116789.1 hypothetical protein [Vibrio cholerae]KFD84235.1 hypothetical protein DN41_2031 [Vibrio cholerae]MCX9536315.1 hypothetical protein [Vibrio cholerae]
MERKFKNIIISSINPNADTVLILSHGGYTPEKGCFRSGSGYVTIPIGITMEFNSEEDRPSIGTKAGHLLEGYPIDPIETVSSGHVIHNYSLSHNPLFDRYRPNDTYDLIKISENGKAHIQDVFRAIHSLNLKYKVIRSFHCRINKSTYKF